MAAPKKPTLEPGYRRMAEAAREGRLDVVRDLVREGYDPSVDIGNGYHPPAYWACRYGRYELLRELIETYGCNPKYVSDRGTTLLHVACTKGHLQIARYLSQSYLLDPNVRNNQGATMLYAACSNGHLEIMKFLEKDLRVCCDQRSSHLYEGESHSLLHTACSRGHLDIVRYLIEEKSFSPDLRFTFDETPLLAACSNGHLPVVRYLIEEAHCNIAHVDRSGTTPLHIACQNGHPAVVMYLTQEQKCNPSCRDNCGSTPLHTACRYGRVEVVRILLETRQVDPSCTTKSGEAPIQIAKDKLIIRELIRMGAKTRGMELKHFKPDSLLEVLMRVFVVGHPSSGKSTLVKALQPEQSAPRKSIVKRYKKVTGVMPQTAGIIPTEIESPEFGRALIFDFAGHSEYYGSHAALLECSNTSSAPLFLLVVDLSESDSDIQHKIRFWLTFLESHRISTTSQPHVIIVGSHKDILKKELHADYKTKVSAMESFAHRVVSTSTSLHMVGFFAIDCRDPRKQTKLRHSLKRSCEELRSNVEVDSTCHFLSVFLLKEFQDRMTCTIRDVLDRVQMSEEPIPCQAERLCELCEALSDRMSILFLKNEHDVEKSWIVLDIEALLQKIHGRIFAPEGFKEHVFAPSSTGVLPFSAIKRVFSEDGLDPSLVVAFLKQLEMCQSISDPEILKLIHGGDLRSDSDDDLEPDSPRKPLSSSLPNHLARQPPRPNGIDIQTDNISTSRSTTSGPARYPSSSQGMMVPNSQLSPPDSEPHLRCDTPEIEISDPPMDMLLINTLMGPSTLPSEPAQQPSNPPSNHGDLVHVPASVPSGVHPATSHCSPRGAHLPNSCAPHHPAATTNCFGPHLPPSPPMAQPLHGEHPSFGHPPQRVFEPPAVVNGPSPPLYSSPPSGYYGGMTQYYPPPPPGCGGGTTLHYPPLPPGYGGGTTPYYPPLSSTVHRPSARPPCSQPLPSQRTYLQPANVSDPLPAPYHHSHDPGVNHLPRSQSAPVQPPAMMGYSNHDPGGNYHLHSQSPPVQQAPMMGYTSGDPGGNYHLHSQSPPVQQAPMGYPNHDPGVKYPLCSQSAPVKQPPMMSNIGYHPTTNGFTANSDFQRPGPDPSLWSRPLESRHETSTPPLLVAAGSRRPDNRHRHPSATLEKSESYLFFPALISSDQPSGCIWNEDDSFTFYSAWCLQCSQPGHFFTPRFLQTLLLRLAFGFPVARPSSRRTLQGLECTLWKNGLRWFDLAGIETLVEMVEDSRGIVMVMRGKRGSEMKCIRLRSQVIRKIIESKEQFCHNLKTEESLLDPSQIGQNGYPVITQALDKLTRYDVLLIVRAIAGNQDYVYCRQGKKMLAINRLLYFEAYTGLGEQLLSDIYEDDSHKSDSEKLDILFQFSRCNDDRVIQIAQVLKIIRSHYSPSHSPSSSSNNLVQVTDGKLYPYPLFPNERCMSVVNRWWQYDTQTLSDFRRALDDYSIFSGRNILELYRCPAHFSSFFIASLD